MVFTGDVNGQCHGFVYKGDGLASTEIVQLDGQGSGFKPIFHCDEKHSCWALLRHLTQNIVLLHCLTQEIRTCWYLLR